MNAGTTSCKRDSWAFIIDALADLGASELDRQARQRTAQQQASVEDGTREADQPQHNDWHPGKAQS
jgi:hypothetical protein